MHPEWNPQIQHALSMYHCSNALRMVSGQRYILRAHSSLSVTGLFRGIKVWHKHCDDTVASTVMKVMLSCLIDS